MAGRSPAQELLGYAGIFTRFPRALHRFVDHPISLGEANARVREQLEQRQASFVHLIRESVYRHPGSPYLPLLELAGCELGDVEELVHGLEGAP